MTTRFERGLNMKDAIDILTGEYDDSLGDIEGIYITPPEPAILTDEDSADEDGGGLVDNLSGRQLLAEAELKISKNRVHDIPVEKLVDDAQDIPTSEPANVDGITKDNTSEDNLKTISSSSSSRKNKRISEDVHNDSNLNPLQTDREQRNTKNVIEDLKNEVLAYRAAKKKKKTIPKNWIEGNLEASTIQFPKGDFSKYREFSACELFELFFDEEIFDMLVRETASYALFKNNQNPNITKENIKCFLGILIFSGYHALPGKRYYWDSQPDMNQQFIVNAMRRNRFDQIMSYIHCADNNNLNARDKLYKLRPLITMLQKKFLEHFVPVQYLSYDESMIEYYGQHGCKQFIKAKPIHFGYKVWCVNAPLGYLINFTIYQGKSLDVPSDYELVFGKSSAPLVYMIEQIAEKNKNLPYICVFDNLFTNFPLLKFLSTIGYGGVGTIIDDREPSCCPLPPKKSIQYTTKRGYSTSSLSKDEGILVCKWHDNGVVCLASTMHGVQPIGRAKRYSQSERKSVVVDRPDVVAKYNENIGGTDRMDENVANYRISVRGKKWYWPIFTWLVDVAIQNAWQLRRSAGIMQPQLDFRREIVQSYIITRFGEASKGPGRPMTSKQSLSGNSVPDDIRYDGRHHYVISTPEKKRRRCAGEGCIGSVRTMCKKCSVGLCIDGFAIFHTVTL